MPTVLTNRRDPIRAYARALMPRTIRPPLEFAEAEIIVPDGPYKDLPFRTDVMPWTRLVLEQFASPRWRRRFGLGSVQSGKTLIFSVVPLLYHLFECGQNVIYLAPDVDMAYAHYQEKAFPVIEGTRYKELLPRAGAGSRGGFAKSFRFGNGARLRFMGARGGDAQRSSHTAPVIIMTEIDKMDTASQWSRETDPVRQGEARSTAYRENARIYGECTASNEGGRIYKETTIMGSHSRVFMRCPHCRQWLYPEREHFRGWQEAETVGQAYRGAAYACQHCGVLWSEEDRRAAYADVRLVHRGQEITPTGEIAGDEPDTFTLGVVWNAMHSSLVTMGMIGEKEWGAENGLLTDQGARREVIQFWWAMPDKEEQKAKEISFGFLARHAGDFPFDPLRALSPEGSVSKAPLPEGIVCLVGEVDVQKRWLYVALDAFAADMTRWTLLWHVIAIVPEGADEDPTEDHLRRALDEARHLLMDTYGASSMWVDCGYRYEGFRDHVVKTWCHGQGDGVNGLVGRSTGQQARMTGKVQEIPAGIPVDIIQCRLQDDGSLLWFFDVDKLKDEVHARLFRSPGSPGYHWFARESANAERTDRSKGPGSHGWIFRHYMNAKQVFEKSGGKSVRRWHETGHHDLWDLAAYGYAGAVVTLADLKQDEAAGDESPVDVQVDSGSTIRTRY